MAKTDFTSNIICLESVAFYALIEEVVERIKSNNTVQVEKWIGEGEAMKLLTITSKTTLQKYRDEGRIRFSQPSRKVILYDRDSILEFIEQHAKNTFQ
ncbi:MAG: helix-turn-helix domain-containing protein [Lewinellaceae bacterium]|nr:helix-turn-helix domain-containing protein [Saprospiraceae bacterium]MCB9338427.1 helix-turn-helix domain-containing protein [Lewinellaceae bacterium]